MEIEAKGRFCMLPLCAFIGLEADVLFRIFLFIPCQTSQIIYGFNVETLQLIWVAGTFVTPIQVALSTLATSIIGTPFIKVLKQTIFFDSNH